MYTVYIYMYSIESIYDVLTYPVFTRSYYDLPQPNRAFLISADSSCEVDDVIDGVR